MYIYIDNNTYNIHHLTLEDKETLNHFIENEAFLNRRNKECKMTIILCSNRIIRKIVKYKDLPCFLMTSDNDNKKLFNRDFNVGRLVYDKNYMNEKYGYLYKHIPFVLKLNNGFYNQNLIIKNIDHYYQEIYLLTKEIVLSDITNYIFKLLINLIYIN